MEVLSSRERPRCLRSRAGATLVLTCEHASHAVPEGLGDLGVAAELLRDHIGWDLGAEMVTDELSECLAAPAILSSVSRLVVDCNREANAADLIPETSHGIAIPANCNLDAVERRRRLREYYEPFHDAVDRALVETAEARLLSIHSFTPDYRDRDFDIGVLFDDHEAHAARLAEDLERSGFSVRMNEPYSGFEGLIFSAQSHGRRFGREYLELEINNGLLRDEASARKLARRVAAAVANFIDSDRKRR
jgi:predicted N-formylglutamate amidohydrolase